MDRTPLPLLGEAVDGALDEVVVAFREQQAGLRRLWLAATSAFRAAAPADREFVPDQLAVVMGVHPRTAQNLLGSALRAEELPALMAAWEADEFTDRHVSAALEELHACLVDPADRVAVLDAVLARCRQREAVWWEWPRPGELRRLLRAAALLHDGEAARRRQRAARQARGVSVTPLPHGQAMLCLEGPQEQVLTMANAIRSRAVALGNEHRDDRTLAQRSFDAAYQLLTGAGLPGCAGGCAGGSAGGVAVEVQVLVPFATATGQSEALGELVGAGPILASTARAALAQARTLPRICIDQTTGAVLAVDPPVPATPAALQRMAHAPLADLDHSTSGYRPTPRALRLVKTRDRTCRFPGCTTPSTGADLDHCHPWPHGPTDPANLQCLCRHHHRAKQSGLFAVALDPDGTTTWTVRATGRTYRTRPTPLTLS